MILNEPPPKVQVIPYISGTHNYAFEISLKR